MTSADDQRMVAAWDEFCDGLKAASRKLFMESAPTSPDERAESFRLLTHVTSLAFDWFVEDEGPEHPRLIRKYTPTRRTTGHNNSGLFHVAFIDGFHTYRIAGNIGTAKQWGISILRPGAGPEAYHLYPYEESFVPEVQLFRDQLDVEWDGSFVLTLSPEKHPGNWVKTTPDTCGLRIREYFADWSREDPMRARIECVDAQGPPPLMSPERLEAALAKATDYVTRLLEGCGEGRISTAPAVSNQLVPNARISGDSKSRGTDTMPLGNGLGGVWELAPDEALVVFLEQPDTWWSLDIFSSWLQPGDYRSRPVTLNSEQAVHDDDGSAWIVIAHDDPGVPNWLDAAGYSRGTMTLRFYVTDRQPVVRTEVVPFADLSSVLPLSTKAITPDDRRAEQAERGKGISRRYQV